MNNMRLEDRIDNYLKGSLPIGENAQFEEELKENKQLREQVHLHGFINNLILERRLLEVRASCKEVVKLQERNVTVRNWLIVLAALIVASIITTIIYNLNNAEVKNENSNKGAINAHRIPIRKEKNKRGKILESSAEFKRIIKNIKPSIISEKTKSSDPIPLIKSEPVITTEDSSISDIKLSLQTAKGTVSTVDNCAGVEITAETKIHSPCIGEKDGTIEVTNFKGGTEPYNYIVVDEEKNFVDPSALEEGAFEIYITDSKGCKGTHFILALKGSICNKDYMFNPSVGETWSIPTIKAQGALKIYNKAGEVVYESTLTSLGNIWNGQNIHNGIVNAGYYIFIITYQDGTYNKGSVTIVE